MSESTSGPESAFPTAVMRATDTPLPAALLWIAALACLAAALLVGLALRQELDAQSLALVAAYAGVGWFAAAATRLSPLRQGHALTAVLIAVTGLLALVALRLGSGLATPGLPVLGLLVCVLCAAAGWRAGLLLAVAATLTLLGVHATARRPVAAGIGPGEWFGFSEMAGLTLGGHLIGIAAGLAAGVLIAQMVRRSLRAANDREARFRSLLGLAADGYWEIDRDYRLVAAIDHHRPGARNGAARGIGNLPWELPQFGCDAHTLDELMADLDARAAFRDRRIRWASDAGATRHYLVSGAPRFDSRGIFTGFWGVVRDISEIEAARESVEATELRYQELFSLIPTPLVLHRRGLVLDANPAAVALFGADNLSTMLGSDLLSHYEGGDSRERARRRSEALHSQPPGTALPVTDFRLRIGERGVAVRATSVSVQAEGGPALLAIFVDDTERLAAEQAVRRSEAMLSHLVATSPDLITLTDLATGRYVMVNRSFERITGWSAAEAIGQTSIELGVWRAPEDRQRLVDAVRDAGAVDGMPTTAVQRGGRDVSMLISAARFVMDRREYLVINGRDITESERDRLQREAILANASIGIAVTHEGRIVLANRHFERLFGLDEGEPLGRPGALIWQGSPGAAADVAADADADADADEVEVEAVITSALARGEPVEIERRAHRKDGSALTVRLRGRAIDPQRPQDSDTVWILEDVTERREFERTLARARDAAEAANRAKTAFLANTSHELRTPLNGLIGLARMAGADDIDDSRRTQYLTQIVDSAQSLAEIISDILDLSKIEAGRLSVERTAFGLGDALRSLHALFAPQAAARQLDLQLALADGIDSPVMGDPLRLRQVVANYLGNAVKFTDTGRITLSAIRLAPDEEDASDDRVRIEVRDSGPGIDAFTLSRLFRPFTQADESITRRYGGTGLGLSICHELALLMKGRVGVESVLGEGSRFWIELPLAPAAGAPRPIASPFDQSGLQGAHVLLVEDNPVNMLVGVSMLERWGVRVTQAHDGAEAVQAVEAAALTGDAFDSVLMDVQMPVMGGHQAARALRNTEAGRQLPIIALTAAALVSEREEALQSGMNDFLTKPIDAGKLHAALLRWRRPAPIPAFTTEPDPS